MPLVQIKGISGYLSLQQKQEIISKVTDAIVSATAPALLNHKDVVNAENAWSSFLSTSCITHRDVGNADIAGANICPCSRR